MVRFYWRHALLAAPQGVVLVSGVCADRLALGEPMADAFAVVNFFCCCIGVFRCFSLSLQKTTLMKILIPIIAVCMLMGCRDADVEYDARSAGEEQCDSSEVTPNFTVPEWGDTISVEF